MSDQQVQAPVFEPTEIPAEFADDPEISRKKEVETVLIGVRSSILESKEIESSNDERFGVILAIPIVSGPEFDQLPHAQFIRGQIERRLEFEKQAAQEQIDYLDSLVAVDPEIVERAQSFNQLAKLIGSALRDLAGPGNPFSNLGA